MDNRIRLNREPNMNQAEPSALWPQLKSVVLPITFQQFMLAAVSMADVLMLGALNQDSLAAVSLATQVQFVFNLIIGALSIGTGMFAAQYWGKGDRDAVEKIQGYVLRLTLYVSFIFALTTFLFPHTLMRLFVSDASLLYKGAEYLRWASASYFFCGISQILLCILKNCGRAGLAMRISASALICNIGLNMILIFGFFGFPRLEIAGAALATVIARIVEFGWAWLETIQPDRVKIRIRHILHVNRILRDDFRKYTLPVLGNMLAWGVGLSMTSVIMGHLGTDAAAANSVASIVKSLVICFGVGLGSGGSIIVGHALGRNELELARTYGGKLTRLAAIGGGISGLLILFLIPVAQAATTLSVTAEHYLGGMMAFCAFNVIGKAVNGMTIGGIFCAGGDSKFGFFCDTLTLWGITVPMGMIAAFLLDWPVIAVYCIVNLDEIIKLPAVYWRYRQYRWVKNLTRNQENSNYEHA